MGLDGRVACEAHQHSLAIFLALNRVGSQLAYARSPLLIRSPPARAIQALQHGSSSDPVLQDIAMLFQAACMDLRISPPMYLLAPAASTANIRPNLIPGFVLQDSATPALRRISRDLAARASLRISLDLFATTSNTFCPHYFSEFNEQEAEGQDALSQPSWASSVCPTCAHLRPEFVLLYPRSD